MVLNYTQKGNAAGPALVFFHGNSADAGTWVRQMEDPQLAARYNMIALDLPGHGASPHLADYKMVNQVACIKETMDALALKEYILVGHSWGTCLVGEYAGVAGDGCKGVVVISPNLTSNEYPPEKYMVPFPELVAIVSPQIPDEAIVAFVNYLTVNNQEAIRDPYVASYKRTDPAFRLSLSGLIAERGWTDEPANVLRHNKPVCIVFGTVEKAVNTHYLDDFPLKWQNQIHMVEHSGHFVHLEQPDATNALLNAYASDMFGS